MSRRLAVLVASGMCALGPLGMCAAQDAGAKAMAADFREIVQNAKGKVFPAVVFIKCIRESTEGGKKEGQDVSGSGVLISAQGEVLTNWHVIDKASSVRCLLSDGRHMDAEVIGSDKDTDLALIKLKTQAGESLPYAEIGDSRTLKEGDFVMAMGAPWGLNRSVSIGIVSCTNRFLEHVSEYSSWIQTDAAINPGNSGGPLVNTVGQIVGINTRGASTVADGLGFAIPSETIVELLPQLREKKAVQWSWLGLQLQPLRDFNRDMYFEGAEGVIVSQTDPDSPARRAGLQPRDRIVRVNGESMVAVTEEQLPAVRRRLGMLTKEQEAVFDIQRGAEMLSFKLTPREKGKVEGDELALERFDFTVKTINQFDNPDLYFHRKQGVFVYGVKYPGNASNAGIGRSDIVLKIDGKDVETLEDVKRLHKTLVAGVASKSRVVITVLRSGLMRQIVLDFARDYSKE